MKSLFSRPIICLVRHRSGTILATDQRYAKIIEINGGYGNGKYGNVEYRTGLYVKRNDQLTPAAFRRMDIDKYLLDRSNALPDKFRSNVKYNIEMVSMSETECTYTSNKYSTTDHRILSKCFIPENILIPHYTLDCNLNPVECPINGATILDLNDPFICRNSALDLVKGIIRAGTFIDIKESNH